MGKKKKNYNDFTDLKQEEWEESFYSLFNNMLEGFALCKIITDENDTPIDWVYLKINKALEELTGLTRKEMLGNRVSKVIPGIKNYEPNLFKIFGKVALTGKPTHIEIFFNPLDSWFSISVYSPKKRYFVTVLDNITERKKAEIQLKKSEENYREAYNLAYFYKDLIAHDMNNILQSLISTIDFYKMFRNDPEKLKKLGDFAGVIETHIKRGANLISNVRKISKLVDSKPELRAIEVFDVLNESVEYIKSIFHDRNVVFNINGISKDMKVIGNDLLTDIFDNILDNALKYNDDEELKVDIEISKVEKAKTKYIKFEIKDYGMGIPNEKKEILFERLYSKDVSKRSMGIGLSLVKKIVDKYDGNIWVEDRIKGDYSKGSNFIIMLKEA